MKKFFLRVVAFALDIIIVSILSALVCAISFINPKGDEIQDKKEALQYEETLARDLLERVPNYIKDDKISQFEDKEILESFPTYYNLFQDVVIDEELSDEFKDNIVSNINSQYVDTANDIAYSITKISLNETIICFIIYMIYFGLVPFFLKGKTLSKILFRLKVVDNEDETRKIPLWKYLVRAFLICELIFVIIDTILFYLLSKSNYINASYWILHAQYIYQLAFLICMILRDDQKSIHDLLLGTKVIRIDKEGNSIPDPIYTLPDTNIEVKEEKKDKKSSTNKKTTTKKKSTKKEEVKAEKVND